MNKTLLVAALSLGGLVVFLVSFGVMLKKCDGLLRAYCVDQRLAALAAFATVVSLVGLVVMIVVWRALPAWLHIVGIVAPILILGAWIKETIFTL
ncbi:MAG TPA: hypothetical protein VD886_07110 [Herpetosiphonaceae bacterium]|nr:hypothetical protein [Herpetosiphonaceae bacterium]